MSSAWQMGTVGDLAEIVKVGIKPADLGDRLVEHYSLSAFDAGAPEVVPATDIKSNKVLVQQDLVLVSRLNPHIPRTWRPRLSGDRPALASTEFVPLRAKRDVDVGYLYQVVSSAAFFAHMRARVTGTTGSHQRVDPKVVLSIPAPIPSPDEQRRIGDVLGAIDDLREANLHIRGLMEARGLTLVSEVVSRQGSGWSESTVGDVTSVVETGKRPRGGVAGYSSGVPSIGAESINGLGVFDYAKTKYVPADFARAMRRGVVESRDVLVYKDGGKPGDFRPNVGLFGDGFPYEQMVINEHVYRVRAADPLTQEYLYFWLRTPAIMSHMRMVGTGAAIPGINSTAFKATPVLIPPRPERAVLFPALQAVVTEALAAVNEAKRLSSFKQVVLPRVLSGHLLVAPGRVA